MKKIITLFALFVLLMTGCNNKPTFTLKGNIEKLKSDTILVYYYSPFAKLDTIIAKEGEFKYSIPADTTTLVSLLIDHQREIPIIIEKDGKATISGSADNIAIDGEDDNMKMNEILSVERKMGKDTTKMQKWIEEFSKKNPSSFTNIYLLNHYFVLRENPDFKRIQKIMANLNGNVKDVAFMIALQNEIDNDQKKKNGYLGNIAIPDHNGITPSWNQLGDKITLITFWASWDKESKTLQDSLPSLKKRFSDSRFQIISISLDVNKNVWKNSLPQDTVRWLQLCDFKGWDGNLIKQLNINRLPYSIITDEKKNIIASDLYGEKLSAKIEETLNIKKK